MRGSTVMGTNDCVEPFKILSTSHIWHCMEYQCIIAQVLFTMYLDIAENLKFCKLIVCAVSCISTH